MGVSFTNSFLNFINHKRYFSDIAIGPYLSYGLDTESKELLKRENDRHVKASQDITLHNITSFIHEFERHSMYFGLEDDKISLVNENENENQNETESRIEKPSLENLKITFLPFDPSYLFIKKKTQFQGKFNRIFISNALAHRVGDASSLLNPSDGKMIVETAHFMPDLTKEQINLFTKKIVEMGNELQLIPNTKEEEILIFKHK